MPNTFKLYPTYFSRARKILYGGTHPHYATPGYGPGGNAVPTQNTKTTDSSTRISTLDLPVWL